MKVLNYLKDKGRFIIAFVVRRADVNKEILITLKSIDKRMSMFEKCIKENRKHGEKHYLITGHWND